METNNPARPVALANYAKMFNEMVTAEGLTPQQVEFSARLATFALTVAQNFGRVHKRISDLEAVLAQKANLPDVQVLDQTVAQIVALLSGGPPEAQPVPQAVPAGDPAANIDPNEVFVEPPPQDLAEQAEAETQVPAEMPKATGR